MQDLQSLSADHSLSTQGSLPFFRPINGIRFVLSPQHIRQVALQELALGLQDLDTFEEEKVTLKLAGALDAENEVVLLAAQADLTVELGVPQTLAADGIAHRVPHHGFLLARLHSLTTIARVALRLRRLLRRDRLKPDDALGEAPRELGRIGAHDGLQNINRRQQPVRGRGHGAEFGVIGANALDRVHFQVDALARAHLRQQDVWIHRPYATAVGLGEELFLSAHGLEFEIAGVDVAVDVEFPRFRIVFFAIRVPLAGDLQLEDYRIIIPRVSLFAVSLRSVVIETSGRFLLILQPIDTLARTREGHQAHPGSQDLILHNRSVVVHEDGFDGQGGDFVNQDPPKGVGDGGIDVDEGEGGFEGCVFVEFDLEGFGEFC